jgi:hypothetical protein
MSRLLLFLLAASYLVRAQEMLVPPYIQPGNAATLSKEQKVLIWQTDSLPGSFIVEYGAGTRIDDVAKKLTAKVSSDELHLLDKTTILYRATLSKIDFDGDYVYRVSLNGETVSTATFKSRTKKAKTRFAVFGDCGAGTPQQAAIAHQVYSQNPQFVLITGDNVYPDGLARQYQTNFFPYYLKTEPDPAKGAPLMRTIPFYMMMGNHDIHGANLEATPDGLAYFYYTDLPQNAPLTALTLEATGPSSQVRAFKKNTGGRYPKTVNYSFDYGNVHIACLDANSYTNPLDPALIAWLRDDLGSTKADWKIVAFHHPAFNSSKAHYDDQLMRLTAPFFESVGVDLILSGHVHNYQRSVPLTFKPKKNEDGTLYIISPEGRVDGEFTLDLEFDGVKNTDPSGIIYVVTGAGGAGLYDPTISNAPDLWKHDPPENWVPFTTRLVSNTHSFTLIETDGRKLILKQVDAKGNVFDEITMTSD